MGRLLLGFLGQTIGLGFQPARIVALVRNARTAVKLQNPARYVIQEVTVVRNRNHGTREVVQEVLQPGDRIGIQVVGRFIEQQHVRGRQQQATKGNTALLTTRQVLYLGIPGRQAQRIGCNFQLALKVVPVACLQDRFELGLFCGQLVEVGIRVGIFGIHLIKTRLSVLDHANGFFNHFAYGFARIQLRFLRQVTDVQVRHRTGFAVELGVNACHDFQQGGFTRTVQAEYADFGPREKRQGDVFQDFPLRRNNFAQPMHGENVRACFACFVTF